VFDSPALRFEKERFKEIKGCRLELCNSPPFSFWLVGLFVGDWWGTTFVTASTLALLLERTDVSTCNKPHAVVALWELSLFNLWMAVSCGH
jgi:hypothetical protein